VPGGEEINKVVFPERDKTINENVGVLYSRNKIVILLIC
jgi:hypothetical protein